MNPVVASVLTFLGTITVAWFSLKGIRASGKSAEAVAEKNVASQAITIATTVWDSMLGDLRDEVTRQKKSLVDLRAEHDEQITQMKTAAKAEKERGDSQDVELEEQRVQIATLTRELERNTQRLRAALTYASQLLAYIYQITDDRDGIPVPPRVINEDLDPPSSNT